MPVTEPYQLDAGLVDAIRKRFADKTLAELADILEKHDLSVWSPEAIEAARQLLLERGEEETAGTCVSLPDQIHRNPR